MNDPYKKIQTSWQIHQNPNLYIYASIGNFKGDVNYSTNACRVQFTIEDIHMNANYTKFEHEFTIFLQVFKGSNTDVPLTSKFCLFTKGISPFTWSAGGSGLICKNKVIAFTYPISLRSTTKTVTIPDQQSIEEDDIYTGPSYNNTKKSHNITQSYKEWSADNMQFTVKIIADILCHDTARYGDPSSAQAYKSDPLSYDIYQKDFYYEIDPLTLKANTDDQFVGSYHSYTPAPTANIDPYTLDSANTQSDTDVYTNVSKSQSAGYVWRKFENSKNEAQTTANKYGFYLPQTWDKYNLYDGRWHLTTAILHRKTNNGWTYVQKEL